MYILPCLDFGESSLLCRKYFMLLQKESAWAASCTIFHHYSILGDSHGVSMVGTTMQIWVFKYAAVTDKPLISGSNFFSWFKLIKSDHIDTSFFSTMRICRALALKNLSHYILSCPLYIEPRTKFLAAFLKGLNFPSETREADFSLFPVWLSYIECHHLP